MSVRIINTDCREALKSLPDQSVHCCVTSPPYFGLRDYGHAGQIGLEPTPDEFVAAMVEVFREVRRVLRDDGTLWLNLGDSYAGSGKGGNPGTSEHIKQKTNAGSLTVRDRVQTWDGAKPKDLIGIPWMVAFALRADGWFLRSEIIWAKPNGMPGSQLDRPTSSHETVFLLSKKANYWSDFDAIKTPPRESTLVRTAQDTQSQAGSHRANGGAKANGTMKAVGGNADKQQQAKPAMMRDVWFVPPGGYREAHFAVMPEELARRCILAGCPAGGSVLDPFGGAGTTGLVADRHGRSAVLIELNAGYADMARARISEDARLFAAVSAA